MAKKNPLDIVYGSSEWKHYQYERTKEANRGNNFQYWNEEKHRPLLEEKGYKMYDFSGQGSRSEPYATISVLTAKEIVEELRISGHYARIIAGYSQNVQRTKMFSIIYKKK